MVLAACVRSLLLGHHRYIKRETANAQVFQWHARIHVCGLSAHTEQD